MWFLITAPGVLHNLFRSAGSRLELCLHLISLELTCRYFYRDGLAPDARHNHAHLIDEFAHLNAHDGAALRHFTHFTHFTNFARIIHQAAAGPFLYRSLGGNPLDVRHLYFVGGSTHSGGSAPLVMLSGKIVAEMIAQECPAM